MAKVDLLCKFQLLDNIIEKYGTTIDQLTSAFYELDAVCDEMESGRYWLGDAHDTYLGLYAEWKQTFLQKLAGTIMFQSALNCIRESLKSALDARDSLASDISASGASSPISADDDSAQVLRISYKQASSADYEIGDSNPRFLDKIKDLLSDAAAELADVSSSAYPQIANIRTNISNYCTDLEDEKQRYTGFDGSFSAFCAGMNTMENELTSTVDSLFSDYLANMDSAQIEKMVNDYALGSLSYDLSNLGISQADAMFLVELKALFDKGEANKETVGELCDAYRRYGVSEELLKSIVSSSWENLRDDQVENIIKAGIAASLGKTTTLSVEKLTEESGKIAAQLTRLSGKADALITKMGKRFPYYAEDGYHKTTLRTLQESIDILNAEKQSIDDQINATVKYNKWGSVVSWTIIGIEVAYTGFGERVLDGLDWDDVCQDMADEAVAGIGGYLAGGLTEAGLVALSEIPAFASAGSFAGPIGAGVGITVGVVLSVTEPLHDFFEEVTDWWDTLWW